MANEYATQAELKSALSMGGEVFADTEIALGLTAASRAIDDVAGRRFYKDADVNQVRYYSPLDCGLVYIDDLIEFTALATDDAGGTTFGDAWTQNTDFVLEPLNAPADGEPWTSIRVHRDAAFDLPVRYPRSIKLTGKFGWVAVPDPVREATIMLAGRLLKRVREAPFGIVAVGMDEVSAARIARSDPDVGLLMRKYIRGHDPIA